MMDQQKQQPGQDSALNHEQLQSRLKQTIKENKSLCNKNTKLQGKYVELFKQQKALKKDHTVFVTFLTNFFNNQPSASEKPLFQESTVGQYDGAELEKLAQQRDAQYRQRIKELQCCIELKDKEKVNDINRMIKSQKQMLTAEYQSRLKLLRQDSHKQLLASNKQTQLLRKSNKSLSEEIAELKINLQNKIVEHSKISKEKLKLQHHLNNIRKKEIAEELSPTQEQDHERAMTERNEFLLLRQQVESLLAKRDQFRKEVKERDQLILKLEHKNEQLATEVQKLKTHQKLQDQKYELVRECSLQQLENLILNTQSATIVPTASKTKHKSNSMPESTRADLEVEKEPASQEIQRQYLKNVLLGYIKAETSGAFDQALTLLEIIGTILKLDHESAQALDNYKSKRKHWWYIKY